MITENVNCVVIGAGPAGVAVVAKLVKHLNYSVRWIDLDWEGGYLKNVPRVPSNTNVSLFIRYATTVGLTEENSPALCELLKMPPNSGCKLEYAHAMISDCLNHLKPQVEKCITGKVIKVARESTWKVTLESGEVISAQNVFLCQGSKHKKLSVCKSPLLSLERVLNGDIPENINTIAVVGTSHSAMLAVMNLIEIAKVPNIHIYYQTSNELKYAYYLNGDLILNDNKGLKGIVAAWCKEHFGGVISDGKVKQTKISCILIDEFTKYDGYDYVVSAIGFKPNVIEIHKHLGTVKWGMLDTGLYGFGIAYPEIMDNTAAVGLWKFVKTINKVLP